MDANWCPLAACSALGVWWGVPGSPRCPVAAAEGVAALAAAVASFPQESPAAEPDYPSNKA